MPAMTIRINRLGDGPSYPEDAIKEYIDLSHAEWKVAFLEGGMQSGNHSIFVSIPTPEGKMVYLQTTWRLWRMATSAFRGAMERWAPPAQAKQPMSAEQSVIILKAYMRALFYFQLPPSCGGATVAEVLEQEDHKLHFAVLSATEEDAP